MKDKQTKNTTLCIDDMVNIIATKCTMNKSEIKEVITLFRDSMIQCIKEGKSVYIVNGWTFELAKTKAKQLKNPKTQKIINIPAGAKIKVKLSSKIKDAAKDAPIE
jgi:nucleoid DNA-binding protein